jgi:NitT/TauT family transport system permease protein
MMMRRVDDAVAAIGLPIAAAVVFCVVWQYAVTSGRIPAYDLPAPYDVGAKIVTSLPELLHHAAISGREAVAAFLAATAAGFVGAVLLAYSPLLKDTLYPVIVGFQLIPKVALAPLFVIWFGTESLSRIAFAGFLSFFPVLIATMAGLQNADPNAVRLCRSLTGSEWQTFIRIRVPFSLPFFFSAAKIAATLAMTGIVVAEFITANAGLGFLILSAGPKMDTLTIFAAVLMLCFIGLLLYAAVALLERAGRRWFTGA